MKHKNQTVLAYLDQLPFKLGRYDHVLTDIKNVIHTKTAIVLPCTLNDLASIDTSARYKAAYHKVDICTTDGMPLVWWFKWQGVQSTERVYGPDMMKDLLISTQSPKIKHVFYGTTPTTLQRLRKNIKKWAPQTNITAMISPPFRELTEAEEKKHINKIQRLHPSVLWIGLSSPKQVVVASLFKKHLPKTLIMCVGAGFDFNAGTKKSAPAWMKNQGLEWLFRLSQEPTRLWSRYLVEMPVFLIKRLLRKPK